MNWVRQLFWAMSGLVLLILGTFVGVYVVSPPWQWSGQGVWLWPVGSSWQVGAMVLAACLGGRGAATVAVIAYLTLGLTGWPVFTWAGGWQYLREPGLGYLLGLVVGAWVCGDVAFRLPLTLENLALAGGLGMVGVHLVGWAGLAVHYPRWSEWWSWVGHYTLAPLGGQLLALGGVVVVAYTARRLGVAVRW
ncbi:BioY family [Gloeomargarita lithophora Alchichica-D10]|uniref:Biotin transporter n=1 Tax=Gloeomargarita lithophora Alchichica-D10 TaxID=1188229 RepID=A0A1J0AGN9_9CYAN|nr:biotin transporter BioY [Gloeomargarita lithophora]APB35079.1 BioY family [Gloeomargarita lithophora Alchichica-D10]